jgi:magnesium-transporting ATPase (P-type)
MVLVERIVPGDVVLLRAGDMVPADLRVVEANNLQVDESALTGESTPVAKKVESIEAEVSLAERSCMLFKGTAVTTGSAVGVTVSAGMRTAVLGGFAIALLYFEMEKNQAVTISFLSLSLARLSHVFNMRDQNSGALLNEITRNPFIWVALAVCLALLAIALYLSGLRQILGLVYPTSIGWTIIIAAGILPLLVGQAVKIFQHARNGTVSTN